MRLAQIIPREAIPQGEDYPPALDRLGTTLEFAERITEQLPVE
jgi:hypothetical protein